MDKFAFDTNIVTGYRLSVLPKGFLVSSVVLTELMSSANDEAERKAYLTLWKIAERENNLITPIRDDWQTAGKILYWLAQARKKEAGGKSPKRPSNVKQELIMDALIAVSGKRENVTIVTNDKDFTAIKYYLKGLKIKSYPFK